MRILQVSSANALGGGETHVLELVQALRDIGHEVVTAGRRRGPLAPDICLPFFNSADFMTALRLRGVLKKRSFDILHAHVARDYSITAAAAWGIPKLKVVFTRHLLYPIRVHPLYRRADGWIAPTPEILQTLAPVSPKLSAVIPNWVDVRKFAFRPHPIHKPVTVGLLGQISPHKGHDDAIEAMRLLGDDFRLLIAGEGEPNYLASLRKKAAGLQVEFAGFVTLPEFFDNADILIVPSWEEPFGIVVLEGMASGTPIIATNRGGPPNIIASALHGILIPPRDPAVLADSIRSLSQDEQRRLSIARNAREHVEKRFDMRSVVGRIEDYYRRLMISS